MERVWNVTAFPLVLDWSKPAIQPGYSAWVTEDEALELATGPDWSLENPRKPKTTEAPSDGAGSVVEDGARTRQEPEVEVQGRGSQTRPRSA